MLKCIKQPYNSVWISAESQDELGLTFMRFQEFYENPNERFHNNIFTVGEFRNWYSETYGSNSYQNDWHGFNFPSTVLKPFKDGLFDPLTKEEQALLELLRYRNDSFYIIGAQTNEYLRHELSHALYFYNPKYKRDIDNLLAKNQDKINKLSDYILAKGYNRDVLNDEIQAYITDNDDPYIMEITCPTIIHIINKIYNKYNTHPVKA